MNVMLSGLFEIKVYVETASSDGKEKAQRPAIYKNEIQNSIQVECSIINKDRSNKELQ